MKKLLIFTLILISFFSACKNENDKRTYSAKKSNGKIIKYINYDDELDIKSTATIDTVEFREQLSQILPNSRILELFGAGYQIFYLALDIYDDDKKAYFQLSPEAGSWVSGFERIQRSLLKENIGLSENFAIIPQKNGDSKAYDLTMVFYSFHWAGKSFKTSPGLINGKKVNSRKTYQIDMSIDNSGKVINQWTIKEINREKFRPQLIGNLMSDSFKGYFPAVLKDDYKSLKYKVEFPKESIKRGVSGKVLVKLFFEYDGKYAGYQLIKGLGYGCEEAVIKTLNDYPIASYPSGERASLILPFSFGASKNTAVDIYIKSFEYNPNQKGNELKMVLQNKLPITTSNNTKFAINVFIDNELIFRSIQPSLNWDETRGMICCFPTLKMKPYPGDETGTKFLPGKKIQPGEHEYKISIDPENVLNDVDRSNNTVRGKLVIK